MFHVLPPSEDVGTEPAALLRLATIRGIFGSALASFMVVFVYALHGSSQWMLLRGLKLDARQFSLTMSVNLPFEG